MRKESHPSRITDPNPLPATAAWSAPALPLDEPLWELLRAFRRHGLAAGHSDRTITSRSYTLERLAGAYGDLLSVDRDDLIDWLGSLRSQRTGQPVTRSTQATYRAQLRAFYAWVQDTGRRDDDPTHRLPAARVPRAVPRPTTPEQVQAILSVCADPRAWRTRSYVVLAAYAGLRVHEIAKIRGEDLQAGQVWVTGKGGQVSSVPFHPMIAQVADTMPTTGWWFPSPGSEGGHVHRCSVSTAIKRAMTRARVPGTPHALRHFYGTQVLRAAGGDLRLTQRAMRHASPATTAIYTQVADDALLHAIEGIPA